MGKWNRDFHEPTKNELFRIFMPMKRERQGALGGKYIKDNEGDIESTRECN